MFCFLDSRPQNLDLNITKIANDIATKVSKKHLTKLTLADFLNNEDKTDPLTEYV
jgi:hypothetical protein